MCKNEKDSKNDDDDIFFFGCSFCSLSKFFIWCNISLEMSEHDELFDAMNFSMDQKIFLAVDDDDRIISTLALWKQFWSCKYHGKTIDILLK